MLGTNDTDRTWETYGATQPYFAVLTDSRYRTERLTEETRREFLDTGERHVERVFATVQTHVDAAFAPRTALDFGCGVGRLAIPLARRCRTVTGVDISPSMLREAAANARRAGVENVAWVESDDMMSRVSDRYDLVHTYIVLQHLPAQRSLLMVRRLLDAVADGGVAALHMLYVRPKSFVPGALYRLRRDLPLFDPLFTRLWGTSRLMQMNPTPLVGVFAALQDAGFGEMHVEFSEHATRSGPMRGVYLFARRGAKPPW